MIPLDASALFAISAVALIAFGLGGNRSKWGGGLLIALATGAALLALNKDSERRPTAAGNGLVQSNTVPVETNFVPTAGASQRLAPPRHPAVGPYGEFAGSASCKECHGRQFETWHDSYHRTMTQVITPETVIGDFAPQRLTNHTSGQIVELGRAGDLFTFSEVDPIAGTVSNPRALGLSTGSHHMQAYWYSVALGDSLGMMPFVYLREDRRWIPREAAFVGPPGSGFGHEIGRWNEICFNCHATGGESHRLGGGTLHETRVAEFGIACEACHGPAAAHVAFRREAKRDATDTRPDPILNPASLDARRSVETCGKCHRALTFESDREGFGKNRHPMDEEPVRLEGYEAAARHLGKKTSLQRDTELTYWDDGMVRVAGRECTGLENSKCFLEGGMSCVDCHSMHRERDASEPVSEWANDQLKARAYTDAVCAKCHEPERFESPEHTHHTRTSEGSRCYNCHMPHTAYGLLKASRSHLISNPSATETVQTRRQNACNICHLDRSLGWTADRMVAWYGGERPAMSADQERHPSAAVAALKGDAVDRVLAAWHLGWEPAIAASGGEWIPEILAILMEDDYQAVRCVAGRSLSRWPGYEGVKFDYVADAASRQTVVAQVRAITVKRLPAGGDDAIEAAEIQRLLGLRDKRTVYLPE